MEGNYGGVDKDEDVEVREFVDENGWRVWWIIKKMIVIIIIMKRMIFNNDGFIIKEISSGEVFL